MAVKTEKELSESLRALWLKAVSAIEVRNFGYAISLLQEILKQEPEFLTGRQLLRRAEVTKTKSAKKGFFNISMAPIALMRVQREVKNDPKRAVEMLCGRCSRKTPATSRCCTSLGACIASLETMTRR